MSLLKKLKKTKAIAAAITALALTAAEIALPTIAFAEEMTEGENLDQSGDVNGAENQLDDAAEAENLDQSDDSTEKILIDLDDLDDEDDDEESGDYVKMNVEIKNILLIGQDTRVGERERSDAMIVMHIDDETKSISLISFMRDMYVELPGHGFNRLNAAYPIGDMELLDQTLAYNFGVKVDGNIEVDFENFKDIIDAMGGVSVYLTQEEADYIKGNNGEWAYLQEGYNLLNGAQALSHSRNRTIGNDYARTDRQRQILTSLFSKASEYSKTELIALATRLYPMVNTDLSLLKILALVRKGYTMDLTNINSYRIPVEGMYYPDRREGMAVLVPDLKANQEYLLSILY